MSILWRLGTPMPAGLLKEAQVAAELEGGTDGLLRGRINFAQPSE